MKKALLTATVQSHIGQFHKPLVKVLHEAGYEVHVAAKNNLAEKNGLTLDFVDKVFDVPFARSPKNADNIIAYKRLKKILKEEHYDIVSCNTPMGGIVTRLAAIATRKKGTKIFYTAHGFHFYKGAPLKNWLVFYPIEKLMAHLCDVLITITKEDYRLARKKFRTNVSYIHGVGVSTERYHAVSHEEMTAMRAAEGLLEKDFVILCVGELNDNKNQKTLIAATEIIKDEILDVKVLLAGNGSRENDLRKQVVRAGLENQIMMLGYRTDLEKITPAVDMVASCSFREGLPLNILEAELCKKPVIASINRGHEELIKDGVSGYKVKADDVNAYAERILEIYKNREKAKKMGIEGYRIASHYTADEVEKELKEIYIN